MGRLCVIIKHIDVLSAAKIMGIISAAFGLLAGLIFFAFGSLFGALLGSLSGHEGGGMAMAGGFMGIILLPILYGVFGFIAGLIQAFIYNIAAGFVGGIRIDTE